MLDRNTLLQEFVVPVQSLSCVLLFATPWMAAHQVSLFFTISQSLLKLMSIESMIPCNHLILGHLLLLLPSASGSFPKSQLFASGGQSTRASASASVLPMNIQGWFPLGLTGLISLLSKRLSRLSSSAPQFKGISSSNAYSGLISFRIDWFDLLVIPGTLKSLLRCHNSKAFYYKG